jgi:hypothetical protein
MPEETIGDRITRAADGPPLPVWRAGFLAALSITANVSQAAKAVGISRGHAYRVHESDPDFAAEWQEALEEACDALEEEARKRAMGEYISYKFTKSGDPLVHPLTGEPYAERVVSDALLTLLLKAHRPDKYKDRSAVETTEKPAPKYDLSLLTPAELTQLETLTRAATPRELTQ